eukprot:PhF_6_TR4523/c0_g1_i2/m.6326
MLSRMATLFIFAFLITIVSSTNINNIKNSFLKSATSDLLLKCKIPSTVLGTSLFTPDASASYGAQWTRDFAYMVDYAGDILLQNNTIGFDVLSAINATMYGQRMDGCMPDRVQSDGVAVMGPGPANAPFADHAWDNQAFAGVLVTSYLKAVERWNPQKLKEAKDYFCTVAEPRLFKALKFQNISSIGLVYNDEVSPNCTYGFTDTVRKTGDLLFTSLVTYDAAKRIHHYASLLGCGNIAYYSSLMITIQSGVQTLRDNTTGMLFAASKSCRQIDVWGSLYAVSLKLLSPKHSQQVINYVVSQASNIFLRGQVRHLVFPEVWQQCFNGGCPTPGTYQNGAYWATPLGWILPVLKEYGNQTQSLYNVIVHDVLSDFETNGIMECVNTGYHGVVEYVASATNVYGGLK